MKKIILVAILVFTACKIPEQGTLTLTNNSGEKIFYNIEISKEPVMLAKINEFKPEESPYPSLEDGEEIELKFYDQYETHPFALVGVYSIFNYDDSTMLAVNVRTISVKAIYGFWFIEIPELEDK